MKRARRIIFATVGITALTAGAALALGPRVVDPLPDPIVKGNVTVRLKPIASGFTTPVTATYTKAAEDTLFVVDQLGKISAVNIDGDKPSAPRMFGDVSSLLVSLGCFGINYDERGAFGLAFHPDYKKNGLVYTFTSSRPAGADATTDRCNARFPDHENVVTEWRVPNPRSDSATIDPISAREVLRVPHPQFNHNGGELRFGPDGYLYVSIGDGGGADDQGRGHSPVGNAQDLTNLNGKILRINPNAGSSMPGYSAPADNPFVGVEGEDAIWAYGFRNPYKMSFDRKTGELYVADVGQNDIEEIDIVTKGGNYGWPVKEGTFAFNNNGALPGFVTADVTTGNYIDPIAQYDHCLGPVSPTQVGPCPKLEGVSITGGFVYRGEKIKELRGHYVFGDYSTGFFSSTGRLFYLDDNRAIKELNLADGEALNRSLLGIGEDEKGELYVLGKTGAVAAGPTNPPDTGITTKQTGEVLRIAAVKNRENESETDND
jgi:glucose/arabinose dehydrogenase